jgi:CheY-like chemotaxis protein
MTRERAGWAVHAAPVDATAADARSMARILIIDDEPSVRTVIRAMLELAGHHVVEAENGTTALAALAGAPIDVVITDILMPDRDGIETILEIRKQFPAVKILAMSGGGFSGMHDLLDVAQKLGAHDTMGKPFRKSELLAKIDRLLTACDG